MISLRRRTIAGPATVSGRGLHGGLPAEATFRPGRCGIQLEYAGERIHANPANVTGTVRSTTVGRVRTVEHVMSALSGLGITDVVISLTTPEMPAMDGSAADFVEALMAAGLVDLGHGEVPFPTEPVRFRHGDVEIDITMGSGRWSYWYESDVQWPFRQSYTVEDIGREYAARVAPARTFLYERDLPRLEDQGLAQGIDRETSLVIGANGYVSNPRMVAEMVAHKLLDLVGDLYLVGIPAEYLDVRARRSGHSTNVAAARMVQHAAADG